MNYLLLICSDGITTPEKAATMSTEVPNWLAEMSDRGVRRFGHALEGPTTAVSVRSRNGQTLVSDGPFAESKEFVGGFDVIECSDLDEAIEIAARHPVARFHCIEVRPFAEDGIRAGVDRGIADPAPDRQRYLLLICVNGIPETDEEEETIHRDGQRWVAEGKARGAQVFGHALEPAETATTVRVRNGQTLISDGPFVETKEFIGGLDIVDCASREEAIELAAAHPMARYHLIEVRPFAREA